MITSFREAMSMTLMDAAEDNPALLVLTPDLARALRLDCFLETYPDKHISVGICETNMVGVAAGLAAVGYIPVISGFSMFVAEKPFEQIRNIIAYPSFNVKIIATHGGLCVGKDGATHQAVEDIALMRVLPNFVVLTACDVAQTESAIKAAIAHDGPVYLRLGRDRSNPVYTNGCTFEIGKSDVLKDGNDIVIFTTGTVVSNALAAAEQLKGQGIDAAVINIYSIKPFDKETVLHYAQKCKKAVTVEDHSKLGGLGSTIAEFLSTAYPIPIEFVGVDDVFGESGNEAELYEKYGLDTTSIIKAAARVTKIETRGTIYE